MSIKSLSRAKRTLSSLLAAVMLIGLFVVNAHAAGVPAEAQRSGFGGERRGKVTECSFPRQRETERSGFRPDAITDYGDAYGHWAYEALTWAVDNGVMVGTSGDKPDPDGYLTRAQMAAMIDRLFGTYRSADISRYTDVPHGSWHYDYIAQAVHMGTFAGYSSSRMEP